MFMKCGQRGNDKLRKPGKVIWINRKVLQVGLRWAD
jgi:hypothetical protein